MPREVTERGLAGFISRCYMLSYNAEVDLMLKKGIAELCEWGSISIGSREEAQANINNGSSIIDQQFKRLEYMILIVKESMLSSRPRTK